jgi:hypothetical protein
MGLIAALASRFLRLANWLNGTSPAFGRHIRDLSTLDYRQVQSPLID